MNTRYLFRPIKILISQRYICQDLLYADAGYCREDCFKTCHTKVHSTLLSIWTIWIKKPTRCHLVLYLFLLYKLLFISRSTCFGPPCAHLQELTTQWYFFTCGAVPWLCRQSDPVGWLCATYFPMDTQPANWI